MIHQFCPLSLIRGIAVRSDVVKNTVEEILAQFPTGPHPIVKAMPGWYY